MYCIACLRDILSTTGQKVVAACPLQLGFKPCFSTSSKEAHTCWEPRQSPIAPTPSEAGSWLANWS